MARIPWIFRCLHAMSVTALLAASMAHGQTSASDLLPPQTVEDALHQMSDKAGVIFVGEVTAVRQQGSDGTASGFVEIQFRVDQAILGCTTGTPYILREWAGLWAGGDQRYRVGQRLLMFLRSPGASGLSSPIDGLDGAIPVHGTNLPLVATGSAVQQYPVADLRWINAKLLRPVSYRSSSIHFDHRAAAPIPFIETQSVVHAESRAVESTNIPVASASTDNEASTASIPAQQTSIQTVIAMLQSWQKAHDAVR